MARACDSALPGRVAWLLCALAALAAAQDSELEVHTMPDQIFTADSSVEMGIR